ncbi:MAG: HD domain-containing protein [Marinilabiliaceae bacterium]|nr:HD domain-containing protein [Marinilabiliaceae bacterium]
MTKKYVESIERWVKHKLELCEPGHDWWHMERVHGNARIIQEREGGNWEIIQLASLLHDVADAKFFDEDKAMIEIKQLLEDMEISDLIIKSVLGIVKNMSFSKEVEGNGFDSLEYRIVQDADRLDAIGAIGIARAFSYGGLKKRTMYDPAIKPVEYKSTEAYRKSESPTINHFYEKLLRLKDKMKTETGKLMAAERHRFMEVYLEQFYNEWEGNL